MDAFIQKFCEKYSLPIALSLQLLDNMEKFTFHKGGFSLYRKVGGTQTSIL